MLTVLFINKDGILDARMLDYVGTQLASQPITEVCFVQVRLPDGSYIVLTKCEAAYVLEMYMALLN